MRIWDKEILQFNRLRNVKKLLSFSNWKNWFISFVGFEYFEIIFDK